MPKKKTNKPVKTKGQKPPKQEAPVFPDQIKDASGKEGQRIQIKIDKDFITADDDEGLEPKQLLFVEEFMVDLNATQAAIRAGYSPKTAYKTGSENLIKPHIQLAIRRRLRYRIEKVQVQQQWVIDELVNRYYIATQAVPVLDMWGRPTGIWKCDAKNALKALELIGEYLNMWGTHDTPNKSGGKVVIIQIPDNGRNSVHSAARRIPNEDAKQPG